MPQKTWNTSAQPKLQRANASQKKHRDNKAPVEFNAGWFFALSEGYDARKELQECFEQNDELTNMLFESMEAYILGH